VPAVKRIATDKDLTISKLWGCLTEILLESNVVVDGIMDLMVGDPYK